MRLFFIMIASLMASTAMAEWMTVQTQSQFVRLINNKRLKAGLINLRVAPDGQIAGSAYFRTVSGQWTWQDGYFCRDLFWGQRELGYNCQKVESRDGALRFTSDRGAGESADFQLD